VSRRLNVVAGFYRTCVIDGLLEHSPADYVRRPTVPPESPTLGLSHLRFEALLSAARRSANPCDFALVAMLGQLLAWVDGQICRCLPAPRCRYDGPRPGPRLPWRVL